MNRKKGILKELFFISLIPYAVVLIIFVRNMFFGVSWVAGEVYGFNSIAITAFLCLNSTWAVIFIAILIYQFFYFIYTIFHVVLKHRK